jgi:hypothetical protein
LTLKNGSTISNVTTAGNFTAPAILLDSFATVLLDNATFSNLKASAIVANSGTQGTNLTIRNGSTISQTGRALSLDLSGGSTTSLVIDGASFTGNAAGMRITGSATTAIDINQLSYTGNAPTQAGGTLDNQISAGNVKIRNSTIGNNGGVGLLLGNPAGSTASLDLGTTASPGNNTLAGNAGVNLYVIVNGTQTINAVGNTWNASVPAVTGVPATDAQGKYPAGTTVTGPKAHGSNFNINTGATLNL